MSPTSYQQFQTRIRQMRRDHHGCTSRGLDVEFARYFYETSFFGEDPAELLSDLKQCAAACIGAGCEPRVRPLPGQDGQGVSLAAPAAADQVEGTPYQQLETSQGADMLISITPCPDCGYCHRSITCVTDLEVCVWYDSQAEETLMGIPGYDDGLTPRQAWNTFFATFPFLAQKAAASMSAPAAADQVEGTPTRFLPLPGHRPDCDCVSCEFPPRGSPRRGPVAPAPRHPFAAYLASCLRDCRNEMKTADVFDRMVIQGRMNDIRRASALYSDFLQECGN